MLRFGWVSVLLVALFTLRPALCECRERDSNPSSTVAAATSAAASTARSSDPSVTPVATERSSDAESITLPRVFRPKALMPLYAGFVVLQTLDYATTTRGLDTGCTESNPFMGVLVHNRPAFAAVKAVSTAGLIYLNERAWKKKNNRRGAVIAMVVIDAFVGTVAVHNFMARQ